MFMRRLPKWALLSCTAAIATPAFAQTDPADAAPEPTQNQASEPVRQTGGLEEIVVTATRREERLQNIPVTVSAVTASTLGNAGVVEVRDLTKVVPGFNGARNLSAMLPTIRGVGSSGVTVGDEANVATYIDDIYQADPFSTTVELVEVERVEVLKGPQGTVFGRNATGGLINVITPDPEFTTRGRITAKYGRMRGDANDYDLRAYVTGGLTDKIAADFAALYRENDGYADDLVNGGHTGAARVIDIRSKLLFEPSMSSRIIVTAQFADSNSEPTNQPFNGNTAGRTDPPLTPGGDPIPVPNVIVPTEPWQTSLSLEPVLDYTRYNLSVRTEFELGNVNLETSTGYSRSENLQDIDSDASNIYRGATLLDDSKVDAFSQEIRLLSAGSGRLNWIIGAYAFHLDGGMGLTLVGSPRSTVDTTSTLLSPEVKTTSLAGFAEGTYEVTDNFFVTLGGRYSHEERKFRQAVNGVPLVGPTTPGFNEDGLAEMSFGKWTYKVALRYNFADDANFYASYGTGFKSGVFNGFGLSGIGTDPEEIDAWEVGMKAEPLHWLRTNISAFYYDYSGLQVTARAPGGLGFQLQNAASAEIYGAEIEVTAAPTNNLQIRTGAGYTHADYEDFPDSPLYIPLPGGGNLQTSTDASGNQMARSPRFTANIGFDWGADLAEGRLGVTGNVFHSSKVYHDFANTLVQEAYELASGEISWTTPDENLRFFLWGTNLTNAKVAQQISPGGLGTYIVYERPRRLGIGAQLNF